MVKSFLSGAFVLVTLVLLGFIFGGLFATRIMTTGSMGFDQIADALGGYMVGSLAGLIGGIVLIRLLSPPIRTMAGIMAIAGICACVLYLRATPPNVRVAEPVEPPPPLVQSFSLTLQTSDPFEGQREINPALPWDTLRMGSNFTFSTISLDEPDRLCIAAGALSNEDGIARLRALRVVLAELATTDVVCGQPICPTCTPVGLVWYLDQERHNIGFDAGCWREEPALQPLRQSVTSIVADYSNDLTCETR